MVERQFSKLLTRVRFPSPAPISLWSNGSNVFSDFGILLKAKVRIKVRMAAFPLLLLPGKSICFQEALKR
jgi:hypothetical protein